MGGNLSAASRSYGRRKLRRPTEQQPGTINEQRNINMADAVFDLKAPIGLSGALIK